jgi:hypothetical protein
VMKVAWCVGVFGACLISWSGSSYAVFETPTSMDGCRIEPYAVAENFNVLDSLYSVGGKQGYDMVDLVEDIGGLTPRVRLEDFVFHLGNGDGIFGICSHSDAKGLAVEVYEYTDDGRIARDAAYQAYLARGYDPTTEIYPDKIRDVGFDISATPALISNCFRPAGTIVYNASCFGSAYCGSWTGAREVLAYEESVSFLEALLEDSAFWSRMDGQLGKNKRNVAAALQVSIIDLCGGDGEGKTVLSPAVDRVGPVGGSSIGEDSVSGRVIFDSRMGIGLVPARELIDGNYNLVVKNERWGRGDADTLRFTLKSVREGTGCFRVEGSLARSAGGVCLDGNRNPPGTDGEGPNGDDYIIYYDCTYTDPNYAARYGSEWAYRDGAGVVVGWHVEAEIETREYVVEGKAGDCWEALSVVEQGDVVAPNVYEIVVPGGYEYYRVVEVDGSGRRGESQPLGVTDGRPALVSRVMEDQRRLAAGRVEHGSARKPDRCELSVAKSVMASGEEVPDWVVYGPESLLVACGPAIAWFESQGDVVDTVYAPSDYF